jgi:hypothetical protein
MSSGFSAWGLRHKSGVSRISTHGGKPRQMKEEEFNMVPKIWHITNRTQLLELDEKWFMTCTFKWPQQIAQLPAFV